MKRKKKRGKSPWKFDDIFYIKHIQIGYNSRIELPASTIKLKKKKTHSRTPKFTTINCHTGSSSWYHKSDKKNKREKSLSSTSSSMHECIFISYLYKHNSQIKISNSKEGHGNLHRVFGISFLYHLGIHIFINSLLCQCYLFHMVDNKPKKWWAPTFRLLIGLELIQVRAKNWFRCHKTNQIWSDLNIFVCVDLDWIQDKIVLN